MSLWNISSSEQYMLDAKQELEIILIQERYEDHWAGVGQHESRRVKTYFLNKWCKWHRWVLLHAFPTFLHPWWANLSEIFNFLNAPRPTRTSIFNQPMMDLAPLSNMLLRPDILPIGGQLGAMIWADARAGSKVRFISFYHHGRWAIHDLCNFLFSFSSRGL